ncbi:hypothetical protein LJ656_19115 [Paraburkholderia sp. MMS20-SJTR3]|uniref:Uncharacterized protein n=1 Tax=Paraburkholderia sejongensis TaxID=2886946 RepID=A0ABS8JXS0_9BURK|nr:hypothetical protein [Paraburkholderia sp. MMS20-SJTR3]MCC8394707.1 hypothetical protein [Paraburkholderia sp. MMS20-SJTR3]
MSARVIPARLRRGGKSAALVAFVVATLLALTTIVTANGLSAAEPNLAARHCSARYAALLDLAELARRDGKSSEVVLRGLSERGGAMRDCLPSTAGERASPAH